MKSTNKTVTINGSSVPIPEPTAVIGIPPPYPIVPTLDRTHPLFNGYYKTAFARYFRACQTIDATTDEEFIAQCRKIEDRTFDNGAWLSYARHTKIPKPKRKKKIKPKRTDAIQSLLYDQHGITVTPNEPIVDYDGFTFLVGGRIRTNDNDIISVHKFIKDYL